MPIFERYEDEFLDHFYKLENKKTGLKNKKNLAHDNLFWQEPSEHEEIIRESFEYKSTKQNKQTKKKKLEN